DKVEKIREILKQNKKPISITEIARLSNISRITAARYLDQMHLSGQVRLYELGKAKKYLLTSEKSAHYLCDLSTNFVLILNRDLKIVYVNEAYLRFSKITRDFVIGKRIESLNLDIFTSPDVLGLLKKYRGDEPESYTLGLHINDHHNIYTISLANVQFASNSSVLAITAQDITSKCKMEDELHFLASIVASSEDAIIGVDLDKEILSWNSGAELIFGFFPEEMIGRSLSVLQLPLSQDNLLLLTEQVIRGAKIRQYQTQMICRDGSVIDVSLTISRILDFKAGFIGLSVIVRDITQRISIEKSLARSKEKLNILSSITRHDILNQLQALDAFCDLLSSKIHTDPQAFEYLTYIGKCSEKIRDHIHFSRDYQDLGDNTPLWQHIETIVKMAAVDNLPASILLTIRAGDYELFADPMLMVVFFNLFDNTIRHGKMVTTITISFNPTPEGGTLIYEDNGVGVPDSMKSDIFEKGVGSNSGFGLFLVREILAITEMSILENGREGCGVRFEIFIPSGRWRTQNG
ncbi:MAG TPA: PAS domain S-box protein, partial [Methanospirillum sp.]|nr:PAS domain S-box protein [Methanospirillum sp.]